MERQLRATTANDKVATAMEVIGSSATALLVFGRYVPGLRFVVNASLGLAGHPYGENLRWSALVGIAWSPVACTASAATRRRGAGNRRDALRVAW
jgi:membrane-associated protein